MGNVSFNPLYVNPKEVTKLAYPGYEGMTNLEHYLATENDFGTGNGVIGVNSAYGIPGYEYGLRTWGDADGDGVDNLTDADPYDPNVPEPLPVYQEPTVPVSSMAGLLGLAAVIGLAGVGLKGFRVAPQKKS